MARVNNWLQATRKAVEWRIISFFIDFLIAFLFTGEVKLSVGIASLAATTKFITNIIWIRRRFS